MREKRAEKQDIERQREKQNSVKEGAGIELCRLENSYGKLAFGASDKEIWMKASRKRSFQEPELASSRKTLEPGHTHQKHRGGRKSFVDSQNKSESAVQVVQCMEDISVKRLTNNLMQLSETWEQKTLNEMLKKGRDPELVKKVHRNLLLVEEQREGLTKKRVRVGSIRRTGMGVEETWTDQVEPVEEAGELPAQEEGGGTG